MRVKRPGTYREYMTVLREAYRAEVMSGGGSMSGGASMSGGGAVLQGVGESPGRVNVGGALMSGGGSKFWRGRFKVYRSSRSQAVTDAGEWVFPLRSSLSRMADSESEVDRVAAFYLFLLCESRFHARSAFAKLIGALADQTAVVAADVWSSEALRRWWPFYVELPSGERRTADVGPSDRRTVGPSDD